MRGTFLAILMVMFVVLATSSFARASTIADPNIALDSGGTGATSITTLGSTDLGNATTSVTFNLVNNTGVAWMGLEVTGTGISNTSGFNCYPNAFFSTCSISGPSGGVVTWQFSGGSIANGANFMITVTGFSQGTENPSWALTPIPVPEPATLALFGVGLLGIGLLFRRKRARHGSPRPEGESTS